MIDFRECFKIIQTRQYEYGLIMDYHRVKDNYLKAVHTLGEFDKNELIVNVDLRVKNDYGCWEAVDNLCNSIRIKASQYFLKRESRYRKLPFVRSIETKEQASGRIKDHAHMMIRMKDSKKFYAPTEIVDIITQICYSMNEINSKDKKNSNPPVNVRTFPFWEDNYNTLGKRIVYICKTSSIHHDPLAHGLYPN